MPGDFDNLFDDGYTLVKSGVLDVQPAGWGFLRQDTLGSGCSDIYVAQAQINEAGLKAGDYITGQVRPPKETEKCSVLMLIRSVNGSAYSFL